MFKVGETEYQVKQLDNEDFMNLLDVASKVDISVIEKLKAEGQATTEAIKKKHKDAKAQKAALEKSQQQLGYKAIFEVVKQVPKARQEVYHFLGTLIGVSGDEFKKLSPIVTFKLVEELLSQDGTVDFFMQAFSSEE